MLLSLPLERVAPRGKTTGVETLHVVYVLAIVGLRQTTV